MRSIRAAVVFGTILFSAIITVVFCGAHGAKAASPRSFEYCVFNEKSMDLTVTIRDEVLKGEKTYVVPQGLCLRKKVVIADSNRFALCTKSGKFNFGCYPTPAHYKSLTQPALKNPTPPCFHFTRYGNNVSLDENACKGCTEKTEVGKSTPTPEPYAVKGQLVVLKVSRTNCRLFVEPILASAVIADVKRGTKVVYMGEKHLNFIYVRTPDGQVGWINEAFLSR